MSNISYKGFHNECMTFNAGDGITVGAPAALNAEGKVINAANGAKLIGVICNVRCGIAGVQLEGYAELPYTGTAPSLGWTTLSANGSGGVKSDANGIAFRVLKVDTDNNTVGFIL